jgi:hypothetical protein
MSDRSVPAGKLERRGGEEPGRSRTVPHHAPAVPRPGSALAVAATAVLWALVASGFRRLTIPAELGTFVPGALITSRALRRDCRRLPAPDHLDGRGTAAWAAVLVLFGIWELYADLCGSTPDHPTLSILMGPLLADPLHRAVGYVLWLALGVWVVRR